MRHTSLRAKVIGWLTALGGALLVLSVLPFVPERIIKASQVVVPFSLRVASHVVSLLVGVLLLFLAGQLGRRKHRAWQVATVLFALSCLVSIGRLDRPVSGLFSLGMVVLLYLSRREFQAPPDPPTLFQFLRFVPAVPGRGPRLRDGVPVLPASSRRPCADRRAQRGCHPQRPGRAARGLRLPQRVLRARVPGLHVHARHPRGRHRAGAAVPTHRGPSAAGGARAGRGTVGARQPAGPHLRQ